jgi:hypothetical protein
LFNIKIRKVTMSLKEEFAATADAMLDVLEDENDNVANTPYLGAVVGAGSGIIIVVEVTGMGSGGSPWEVEALQNEISGLKQARSTITGSSSASKTSRQKINQTISHKHTEMIDATPYHPPVGEAIAEVGGSALGGVVLGAFTFTAIAARARIFKQRRLSAKAARA